MNYKIERWSGPRCLETQSYIQFQMLSVVFWGKVLRFQRDRLFHNVAAGGAAGYVRPAVSARRKAAEEVAEGRALQPARECASCVHAHWVPEPNAQRGAPWHDADAAAAANHDRRSRDGC